MVFFFFLVCWFVFVHVGTLVWFETGIVVAVLSLKNFLAKDDCLALEKQLYNSEKETSQEAMESVGIQSKIRSAL